MWLFLLCIYKELTNSVVAGLTPLWFMVYYKIFKIKDEAKPIAGIIMAASAILVILFGG